MGKALKWLGGIFVVLIVIGTISSLGKSSNTLISTPSANNSNSENNTAKPTLSKSIEWTTVLEASGVANKKTDVFTLNGRGKTRMTYDFEGRNSFIGIVYVVKEGNSIDEEGGIPEVWLSKAGSDSTFLVKQPGNYYVDVRVSDVNWTIKVEEER